MLILIRLGVVIGIVAALSGCIPVVIGGGALVGSVAIEERSVGATVSDAEIRSKVGTAWYKADRAMYAMLSMAVREGRVLVIGRVTSEQMHQDAIRLVWTVQGVQDVIDEITVAKQGEALGDYSQDAWITTKLETLLLFDGKVASRNYKIKTMDRVVYLIGIARTQAELDRVLDHARHVKGVKRVVSHVRVKEPVAPGAPSGAGRDTVSDDAVQDDSLAWGEPAA